MTLGRPGIFVSAIALSLAADARAQGDDLCLAPHVQGQELRQQGHLEAARDRFRECTRAACPIPVREDCAKWEQELVAAVPTVVVRAQDASGRDVTGVRVSVDGAQVSPYTDGLPFEIDPGAHALVFEAGGKRVELSVVLREGEKDRALSVVFPSTPPPRPAPPAAPVAPPEREPARPIPALAWVLGGVGVAGIGVFATLGAIGLHKHAQLRSTCAPTCTDDQKSGIVTDYAIGDISLAVGVASIGVATVLVLTRPRVQRPVAVEPLLWPGGGGVRGAF